MLETASTCLRWAGVASKSDNLGDIERAQREVRDALERTEELILKVDRMIERSRRSPLKHPERN